MSNDNKEKKENRGTGKKVKRNNIIDQYFNRAIIIFLLVMMLLMIYNLRQYGQLYQSIDNLNQVYSDIQTENRVLKERIEEQNQKLDNINNQMANYLKEKITKEQFTEIYMQLQELTGMISEEKKREFYMNRIVNLVSSNNKQLESETIYDIAKNIYEVALKYKFNPFLICALIKVESNFIVDSISDSYAYGLCQVRRFIAKELAENIGIEWDGAEKTLLNPEKNIKIGIHYLALLYDDFGDIRLALTAYNYGPFKVQEFLSQENEIPNGFTEKILHYYSQYRGFEIEDVDEVLNEEHG
ncbi:MAG: transglycosylase SLT domain-containing protein [Atribacterota bacterium]|nr:transglycosylase SLT domain-containing protein [Atribacterota bacterium]MDD4896959.1 transglycosylase SLT domain-containing protein [Atribacterota bacterium]MDD5636314.1 transglycosylase SLT domain-containing protein [Atribacterota bacterium]